MKKAEKIGIIAKTTRKESRQVVEKLVNYLRQKKAKFFLDEDSGTLIGAKGILKRDQITSKVDLLVVIGGDGTLLSAARSAGKTKTPILGINLGSLGFLTEVALDELYESIDRGLKGKLTIETRMMLQAEVFRKKRSLGKYSLLNDIVINKSALARIVDLSVEIDGYFVTTYKADGLIVSTPTGSTAYSLSAGGPIVFPDMKAILITPICPHTLTHRPLVIPDHAKIAIKLMTEEDVYFTLDGQRGFPMRNRDIVRISRSKNVVKLIRPFERNYFDLLRRKLKWGER